MDTNKIPHPGHRIDPNGGTLEFSSALSSCEGTPDMAMTYLALLRGINVGGKNNLPMKDLVDLFVGANCVDVRTYIQSGNVVFRTDPDTASRVPGLITALIGSRYGYHVPLVLRTTEQIGRAIDNNPFLQLGIAEESLHVLFLAEAPDSSRVETLDPERSPPDAFALRGQEIYLHLPNGVARSKLTNQYFDAKLATITTARKWRTVTRLFAMMTN